MPVATPVYRNFPILSTLTFLLAVIAFILYACGQDLGVDHTLLGPGLALLAGGELLRNLAL